MKDSLIDARLKIKQKLYIIYVVGLKISILPLKIKFNANN